MSNKYFWGVYKQFYDPPGTPPELRCIKCRYAAAGAGSTLGLAACYGVAKTMKANVFKGMICVFTALFGFSTSAIALKMAKQDKHWNETRYLELQAEVRAKRMEYREQMQQQQQQKQPQTA